VLRDAAHGGWFHAVAVGGEPDTVAGKTCYDHAFVMLAAASATVAGRPGARELLAEATGVYLRRFWDDEAGRPVDTWDVAFTALDPYRGLNSTMHSVEAMLTVADAVDDPSDAEAWRDRAARAAAFVVDLAREHDGRLPEHFGPGWTADLELNKDRPDDQFKPYGATPGHGLEWSRLLLHVEAVRPGPWLETAVALFDRAVADGWAADGADGFVYTTDWQGTPVVRTRMHWVVAEAIAAASALHTRTTDERFAALYSTWWDYADRYLIDIEHGSWHHELDADNRPAATVWPGKPDVYHALQATLVPRLPLAPTLARAVARGALL
jgi:mannose/cellobiose epimerase-like protein (N-acyl-D-glucosamine 2-epimerase family)